MTRQVVHKILGYHRQSERLAVDYAIPARLLSQVCVIAAVDADDPDALASYALDSTQMARISDILGEAFDPAFDFYLEPVAIGSASAMRAAPTRHRGALSGVTDR